MPEELRASIIMDYQNIHLSGRELFPCSRYRPIHECLVDPLSFAHQVLRARNANQRDGHPHAVLADIWVYRGEPSQEHDPTDYARSQAQKSHWERDPRVHVHLRPLKYDLMRDASGTCVLDERGKRIVLRKREKGVDVLCALAMVREASRTDIDLVLLASQDSDLQPAIDEAIRLGAAKVETMRWRSPDRFVNQLRPTRGRIWNTSISETAFQNSWDRTAY